MGGENALPRVSFGPGLTHEPMEGQEQRPGASRGTGVFLPAAVTRAVASQGGGGKRPSLRHTVASVMRASVGRKSHKQKAADAAAGAGGSAAQEFAATGGALAQAAAAAAAAGLVISGAANYDARGASGAPEPPASSLSPPPACSSGSSTPEPSATAVAEATATAAWQQQQQHDFRARLTAQQLQAAQQRQHHDARMQQLLRNVELVAGGYGTPAPRASGGGGGRTAHLGGNRSWLARRSDSSAADGAGGAAAAAAYAYSTSELQLPERSRSSTSSQGRLDTLWQQLPDGCVLMSPLCGSFGSGTASFGSARGSFVGGFGALDLPQAAGGSFTTPPPLPRLDEHEHEQHQHQRQQHVAAQGLLQHSCPLPGVTAGGGADQCPPYLLPEVHSLSATLAMVPAGGYGGCVPSAAPQVQGPCHGASPGRRVSGGCLVPDARLSLDLSVGSLHATPMAALAAGHDNRHHHALPAAQVAAGAEAAGAPSGAALGQLPGLSRAASLPMPMPPASLAQLPVGAGGHEGAAAAADTDALLRLLAQHPPASDSGGGVLSAPLPCVAAAPVADGMQPSVLARTDSFSECDVWWMCGDEPSAHHGQPDHAAAALELGGTSAGAAAAATPGGRLSVDIGGGVGVQLLQMAPPFAGPVPCEGLGGSSAMDVGSLPPGLLAPGAAAGFPAADHGEAMGGAALSAPAAGGVTQQQLQEKLQQLARVQQRQLELQNELLQLLPNV